MQRIRAILVRGQEEKIADILTASDRFVAVVERFRLDHPEWRVEETWEVPLNDIWVGGFTGIAS